MLKWVLEVPPDLLDNICMLDKKGKGLEVGDIVKVNNEDSEFIILHIHDASLQLAELGEGIIISNGNEVEKIDW